ncbi:hypothetical protein [Clostridium homopropionicum]|uniref:hypothetical protein n=1 Tax=Clostridium homopropionicum TaxID=36844 RepID=UPI0011134B87|nr:hypothetical protein [Clostridium homopropionicum]
MKTSDYRIMIKNLKEYFNNLDRLEQLKQKKSNIEDFSQKVKITLGIINLENRLFDFTYGIRNYLNDEEQKYIKFKYINKFNNKALEVIFNKSESTLRRFEKKIVNKLFGNIY